ncbi:MAG: NAD-glutamate dehydrogenase domain-containing protein, partial [Pseudomonadota bacterium]
LLDLLCPVAPGEPPLVDRWQRPEVVYLGPDENVSPALINWLVERARQRKYPMPEAFISSKPAAGINHKEYGVTSEGVTVFLEEALGYAGIDPRRAPFTVKLTGGPDGDVAGNEIKILKRNYGDNARIVLVSDGSGFASDPEGLDGDELLRLVAASQPIAHFDRARLSARGELVSVDEPDGLRRRNDAHNRVIADAFVPAGGRPETLHRYNWENFLLDGKPTAKVIVEGANLFITREARAELSRHGVLIVKDSSANKTGVICSSYEIIASMLLSPAEFLTVKERFVEEVLDRLRDLARREAQLLFREKAKTPEVDLPTLSVAVSRRVIAIADAIEAVLEGLGSDDRSLVFGLVHEHLPATLLELAGDRIVERIPASYCNSIISSALASRIVYREGLEYLPDDDPERLAEVALNYLRMEHEIATLIDAVRASGVASSSRIVELLRAGGSRDALRREARRPVQDEP